MQDWNELEPLDPDTADAGSADLGAGAPVDPGAGGRGAARPRRLTRTAIVSGVAAVILVVAGISMAVAQTSPSTTTPSTTVPSAGPNTGKHGGGFNGRRGLGPFGGPGKFGIGGMGGIVHGEFVRPNGSNGYQTVDVQTGQVTSVSSSSITLKSADGFTKTYSVTTNTLVDAGRDGIGSVKKGDNATVDGVVSGSTSEARNINDLTNLAALRQHWAPQQPAPNTPSSTGTSST